MKRTLTFVLLCGLLAGCAAAQSTLSVGIEEGTRTSWDAVVLDYQTGTGRSVTLQVYSATTLWQQFAAQGVSRSGNLNLAMVHKDWASTLSRLIQNLGAYERPLLDAGASITYLGKQPVGVWIPFAPDWFLAVISWPQDRQAAADFLAATARAQKATGTATASPTQTIASFRTTKVARTDHNPRLDGSLEALLGAVEATVGTMAASAIAQLPAAAQMALTGLAGLYGVPFSTSTSTVTVVLEPTGGKTSSANVAALSALGVSQSAIDTSTTAIKITVPISQLRTLVAQLSGISFIRPPYMPYPLAVTGQGVAAIGASAFHAAGYTGSGAKVAVIDLGFAGLSAAQASGDMPYSAIMQDFTGTGISSGISHGTAVAEIAYEIAPAAQLYLIKIGDEVDLDQAVTYCLSNGIDIINHSLGWYNTNFYDGTGTIADIAKRAIAGGILWVNAAGNEAESHWEGTFSDGNADTWNDQSASLYASSGSQVILYMTWDNWPAASSDYDLYLYDPSNSLVASSTKNQTGTEEPTESIMTPVPTTGTYTVRIKGAGSRRLELYSLYHNLSPALASSSLLAPADVAEVVAVGAIGYAQYTTGPQESYSSQGPTNDGRTKPDLCTPDNVSTGTSPYTTFAGTSGAAPHASGAAALLLSREPTLSGSALRSRLLAQTVPMGSANVYGQGRLFLSLPANQAPTASFTYSPPSPAVGQTVTFNGSGSSDPDGSIVSYSWAFGTGATGSGATATYAYPSAATYTVSLTVTDSGGALNTATRQVTVSAAPLPDLVVQSLTHSPANPALGQAVSFSVVVRNQGTAAAGSFRVRLAGASSSTQGTVASLAAGASTTLTLSLALSQDTETFTAIADDLGQVMESNEGNNTAQDVVQAAAPQAVVAEANGPYSGSVGQAISFSAAGSSGPISSYAWSFGDGGTGSGASATHAYSAAGTYTATLTVYGTSGQQASDSAQVSVSAAPRPDLVVQSLNHSPTNPTLGQAVSFSVVVRNQGTAAAGSFRVRLAGASSSTQGTVSQLAAGASTTLTLSLALSQTTETFTATADDLGQVSESSEGNNAAQDVVQAAAPQAVVAEANGPYAGTVGQAISFSAAGSSGPISSYAWSFGDGGTGSGASVAHAYGSPGTYTATLTVYGSFGQQATDAAQVTVSPAAPALSILLSLAKGSYQVGESIVVNYTVNRPAYVYLCNVDSTGTVTLIFPNYREPNPYVSAGSHAVPGTSYSLQVSGPTGSEVLLAFAATGPISSFPTSFGSSFPVLGTNSTQFRNAVRQTMQSQFPSGSWAEDTLSFTTIGAANQPPTASFTFAPLGPSIGQAVTFSGTGSVDPDGTIVTYAWDFGDGASGSGPTVTHAYSAGMSYPVRLTVTDSGGASATTTRTVSVSSVVLPPLRAYYAFNEASGATAQDGSGNGNHGTISGATRTTSDDGSGALLFNGTSSQVKVASSPSLSPTDQLTLEAWIRPDDLTGKHAVVEKGYTSATPPYVQYALWTEGTEVAYYLALNGTLVSARTSGAGLLVGAWYHIAGVYDGSTLAIYVNRALRATASGSGSISSYATELYIGRHRNMTAERFKGTLDEVKIHARAVDPAEFYIPPNAGVAPAANLPPIASFTWTPAVPQVGQQVRFISTSRDPDGTLIWHDWNFGDGRRILGPRAGEKPGYTASGVSHTYTAAGTYNVTLTVTDDDGAMASTTQTISILQP